MLSYQHIYHAGNQADIHKHMALAAILDQMAQKPKPLTYMETHAGRGIYDLSSPEALKTGEAEAGIGRSLDQIPVDHPYRLCIDQIRKKFGEGGYPGSPAIAAELLRGDDQLHLMELHPQEFVALKRNMKAPNIHVHRRDGCEGVLAISPPTPRRGMVLIDPSFEVKSEYDKAAEFIINLHKKWPQAVVLLWYPILEAGHHVSMFKTLGAADLPKEWHQEILFRSPDKRMLGSGLYAVNTPYGVVGRLESYYL